MRYLCIDLGDKRTGLALGDSVTRIAAPLKVLEIAREANAGELLLAAITHEVATTLGKAGELVVGLPLNMDETEGPRAKLVREFALRLPTGYRVHFHDERLSTAKADWTMSQSGLTHQQKKLRRDALAAAAILQDFLDALPPDHAPKTAGW